MCKENCSYKLDIKEIEKTVYSIADLIEPVDDCIFKSASRARDSIDDYNSRKDNCMSKAISEIVASHMILLAHIDTIKICYERAVELYEPTLEHLEQLKERHMKNNPRAFAVLEKYLEKRREGKSNGAQ